VLAHAEIGEHLPALRHQRQAAPRDAVGRPAGDVFTAEPDAAAAGRQPAAQAAQQRALAHAVAAQQRRHFAGLHRQLHAEQHLAGAIAGLQPLDLEQRRHAAGSISSPR
jgi:hypothetical protein